MLSHRLRRGDVVAGDVARLMGDRRASLAYSDPPWGPGNLKYWRTANGESARPDWGGFLDAFAAAVSAYCDGPILVEMGERWVDDLSAAMSAAGCAPAATHRMDYGRPPRPQRLCLFGGDPAALDGLPADCWAATREVARRLAVPGGILMDPCLGLGKSAGIFAGAGMVIYGLELNPARLSRAARRLGCSPCR